MGEISDLMLSGKLCEHCGACLDEKVIEQDLGFPVICEDCYRDLNKKEKQDYEHRHEKLFS